MSTSKPQFVHLHTHSHYSLLGALPEVDAIVERAKEQGATSIALTDADAMYGAIPFYQACQKHELNPIIGLDVHIAPNGRAMKRARIDKQSWQLVLLATSRAGYKELLKLSSIGFLEGFYYTARIDDELLKEHHTDLIALSGGIAGEIPTHLRNGDREKGYEKAKFYAELFGKDHFYIELIHRPDDPEQVTVNDLLIELATDLGLPMVVTSNSFYLNPDDHEAWETLRCIQKGQQLEDYRRMSGVDVDLSMTHPDEIIKAFAHVPEAIENTVKIAERCKIDIPLYDYRLPVFEVPEGKTDAEYLREVCEAGLQERYGEITTEIRERFEHEYEIIARMGFASYFLIVYDFIKYAKDSGILVGPGRGSAAGSIIAYVLKITDLDPLHYGLLFERFLNPERVSMPDIDMDFADSRRAEVLDYVTKKYGADHVAGIITFGKMMPRAAVRDAARVLGLDYASTDKIAKLVPPPVQGRHTPLKVAIEESVELRAEYRSNPMSQQVIDLASKIEGTPRHASQHACGIVISDKPLVEYVSIQESQHEDLEYVSQFSLNPVEAAGLVKMDFLGLSNLTIIEQALNIIKAVHDVEIDIEHVTLEDQATFDLLSRGETVGVFQFESEGMQRYLKDLKPTEFEDLIAMVALYRPGPLSAGMVPQYINRKNGREKVVYDHPLMEDILKQTYGVTVYQEQIMHISRTLAGFSGAEADTLRKAMGKKKRDVLAKMKASFVAGCSKNGVSKTIANKIWADWEGFADYAFNKSHAACYGLISYRTAYLKAHYPAEFMAAVMNSDAGNIDRMTIEVQECKRIHIEVLPPDINESFPGFGVVGSEKKIRWGLMAIKNVGEEVSKYIVEQRKEGGPYKDLADFLTRMESKQFNKKALEALIMTGAFDAFGERGQMLANMDRMLRYHKTVQKQHQTKQSSLFDLAPTTMESVGLSLSDAPAASRSERLGWERELLGIYVSEHPFTPFAEPLNKFVVHTESVQSMEDKAAVRIAGVVSTVRTILTKKGDPMAFVKIEDQKGEIETVFFPRTYKQFEPSVTEGMLMIISGKVSEREGQAKSVLVDSLACFDERTIGSMVDMLERGMWVGEDTHRQQGALAGNKEAHVQIELSGAPTESQIANLREVFQRRPGKIPVMFLIEAGGGKKQIKTPFSITASEAIIQSIAHIIGKDAVKVVGDIEMR